MAEIKDAELFANVLDKNEKVIKVMKPNKLKLFVYWFSLAFWISLWIGVVSIIPMSTSGMDSGYFISWQYYMIPVGVMVLTFILTGVFAGVYYHNCYFAYTNSRVLIRTGIIGIDYKSLDMRYIGAINVKVGFWDKVLKKETGSISFGSMSSPMATSRSVGYNFAHIEKPYDIYKEMKEVVENVKEQYKIAV